MNIYEKMSAITAELTAVAKNLTVGIGKSSYKAVGEADVLAAVKPIEAKNGVYSYPVKREIIKDDVMTTKSEYNGNVTEKQSQFLRISVTYRFVNTEKPDEYIDITSYGDGVDSQDKAPGKAMTYADKYALLKAYKIITGEDPDQHGSENGKFGKSMATATEKKSFLQRCEQLGVDYKEILQQVGCTGQMTQEQHGKALIILKEIEDAKQ